MRNKKIRLFFILIIILGVAGFVTSRVMQRKSPGESMEEITPSLGSIRNFISCTGTVLPKNRLEVKPSVNGRIENILVKEGDNVKIGQTLAWMSSTERAALLDAARGKSEETLKYFEEVYKAISLAAPIDGEVIVATTQPGQTVTASDAVLVLSDRLIVRAQVDEVDIGKITVGKKAIVSLDAYPEEKIDAVVDHIYYESKTVNNVTIYEVDLMPAEVPLFFRSGMNATVNFIEESKEGVLLIPIEAVFKEKGNDYVWVKQNDNPEPLKALITLGLSDDKNVEVLSGINQDDKILLKMSKYSLPTATKSKNPFMPGH
jgi:macrolide-specific efflux system membrane fusion protein